MLFLRVAFMALTAFLCAFHVAVFAKTLTIATVNNGDMIRMQRLSSDFEALKPGVKLRWVILEENTLRQKVTVDIANQSGQYDVMTIGTYETPIWAKKGWLVPLDQFSAAYNIDDLLPPVRDSLTVDNQLFAAPFYAESSLLMYRQDVLKSIGLEMPVQPTWKQIQKIAKAAHNPAKKHYGICLRGKAGWGENMAVITTIANAFGGRWFDEKWRAQFDTSQWRQATELYVNLLRDYGPPGASSNGFNENLALFNAGHCAMWLDASVAAAFVTDPKKSTVYNNVRLAPAPCEVTCKGSRWLWAWALAIPKSSRNPVLAAQFIEWATSADYLELAARHDGWANVPPGTRESLYQNPEYLRAAPFARQTYNSIMSADPVDATLLPKPYIGIQYVAIPEFQSIGTRVGQQFSAAVAGKQTVAKTLANAQTITERQMRRRAKNQRSSVP